MNQACTAAHCGKPSIPGLIKGSGKCAFHWAKGVCGIEWAAKCHPDHQEAKSFNREKGNAA